MKKKEYREALVELENLYRINNTFEDWTKFRTFYDNFSRKLSHLFILYNNLCETFPSYSELMKIYKQMIEATSQEKILSTDIDINGIKNKITISEIAIEDFFIHSKILLDYIPKMTLLIFPQNLCEKCKNDLFDSFSTLKYWFIDENPRYSHDNIPTEFKVIITNTDWFKELNKFRNYMIIHPRDDMGRGMKEKKETGEAIPIIFHSGKTIELPNIEKIMNNILTLSHYK